MHGKDPVRRMQAAPNHPQKENFWSWCLFEDKFHSKSIFKFFLFNYTSMMV